MPQSAHLAGLSGPSVILRCLAQLSEAGTSFPGSEAPKVVVITCRVATDNAEVCLQMQSMELE